jgi:hypothetical protein
MIAEVNARLPEGQKLFKWWWTVGKYLRFWEQHKRLCPASPWRLYWALSSLMAIVFIILILLSFHAPNSAI